MGYHVALQGSINVSAAAPGASLLDNLRRCGTATIRYRLAICDARSTVVAATTATAAAAAVVVQGYVAATILRCLLQPCAVGAGKRRSRWHNFAARREGR